MTRDKTPAQRAFGRRIGIARSFAEKRLRTVEGIVVQIGPRVLFKGTGYELVPLMRIRDETVEICDGFASLTGHTRTELRTSLEMESQE